MVNNFHLVFNKLTVLERKIVAEAGKNNTKMDERFTKMSGFIYSFSQTLTFDENLYALHVVDLLKLQQKKLSQGIQADKPQELKIFGRIKKYAKGHIEDPIAALTDRSEEIAQRIKAKMPGRVEKLQNQIHEAAHVLPFLAYRLCRKIGADCAYELQTLQGNKDWPTPYLADNSINPDRKDLRDQEQTFEKISSYATRIEDKMHAATVLPEKKNVEFLEKTSSKIIRLFWRIESPNRLSKTEYVQCRSKLESCISRFKELSVIAEKVLLQTNSVTYTQDFFRRYQNLSHQAAQFQDYLQSNLTPVRYPLAIDPTLDISAFEKGLKKVKFNISCPDQKIELELPVTIHDHSFRGKHLYEIVKRALAEKYTSQNLYLTLSFPEVEGDRKRKIYETTKFVDSDLDLTSLNGEIVRIEPNQI